MQAREVGGGGGNPDVTHDVRVVEHRANLVEQALNRLQESQKERGVQEQFWGEKEKHTKY